MSKINRSSFKDRIIENVAKAIKGIQEIQIYHTSDEPIVLTSHDRPARKLLEYLDHVLLHGLRHITNGYWKIVSEFTTKNAVREINRLTNIATDSGRGRAWLCMSLNEGLMESYFRCYEGNIKLVKKYYIRDALVLDQQRLNVLITLISGIELVTFQLDYDVPYLDIGTAPPHSRSRADSEESESDRLSLCSMDSVASNASKNMVISRESPVTVSESKSHALMNGSLGQIDENIETKFDRLENVMHDDIEPEDTSIEVIHVTKRGSGKSKKHKGKKNKKDPVIQDKIGSFEGDNQSGNNSEVDRPQSLNLNSTEQPEPYQQIDNLDKDVKPFYKITSDVKEEDLVTPTSAKHLKSQTSTEENTSSSASDLKKTKHFTYDKSLDVSEKSGSDDDHFIEDDYLQGYTVPDRDCDNDLDTEFSEKVIKEFQDKHNVCLSRNGDFLKTDLTLKSNNKDNLNLANDNTHKSAILEHNGDEVSHNSIKPCDKQNHDKMKTETGNSQVNKNSSNENSASQQPSNVQSSTSQMQDLVDNMINQSDVVLKHHLFEEEPEDTQLEDHDLHHHKQNQLSEGEVKLDNNTLLYLMLDVFDNSEEQFVKLFATTEGHTDGECTPLFLTITDRSVYFLSQKQSDHRFYKDVSIPFSTIHYISLGVYGQTLHIVCTNKRNQYWVTTGNQLLTKTIVDCILDTCKEHGLSPITVDSDATVQKVALKKYISKECLHEDNSICCYSLVHWDTPSGKECKPEKLHREGHLLYKLIEPIPGFIGSNLLQNPVTLIYGQSWKPAYVVLKDGLLCIYNDKNDSKPIMFVKVGGEDCTGCRRLTDTDREHCIQIIKSDGSSIQLALATGLEASDWLQSLCQAVAEGLDSVKSEMGCMSCCLVLSQQKLLMCHEDLQSSFYRTLGSANIIDVTYILQDPAVKTYCVLAFESHDAKVSNEHWALHFYSEQEKTRFIKALSDCWEIHFKVEVPIYPVEDFSLMKICQEMSFLLRDKLTVKKSS